MGEDHSEVVPMDDTATFFGVLKMWHEHQVETLKHMLTIPEGTDLEVDGQTVKLEGVTHLAFQAGIRTALSVFENLPFDVVNETDEPEQTP